MCCKTVKCLFDIVTFHDQTTKGDSTKEPPFSFARMCELNTMKRERSSDGIETDKAERTPAHSQGPCHAENCH